MTQPRAKHSVLSGQIVQSEIRNMSIECDRAGGINLAQGICDLPLPKEARDGAVEAMDAGINTYTRYDGLPELRAAIAEKSRKYNGLEYDPETEIVASCGATGAFYCACLAMLNPGDEVIVFEPYYGYHVNTLLAVRAVPRYCRMAPPDFKVDFDALARLVNPKTRAVLINTPANPSGKVFPRTELEMFADFCEHHGLLVFTDEIYEYFVYNGKKHLSPAAVPGLKDRTLTISGYSKTFSITGWRIGYLLCHANYAKMIGHVNDLIYVCAPAPLQIGAARGITRLPDTFYTNLCAEYLKKRDLICKTLADIGLPPCVPEGAYYVLADIGRLPGATAKEKAMHLLKTTGVAGVPGGAFYHDDAGESLIRFCFAKGVEELERACGRLRKLPG
jgi:aminotransferase